MCLPARTRLTGAPSTTILAAMPRRDLSDPSRPSLSRRIPSSLSGPTSWTGCEIKPHNRAAARRSSGSAASGRLRAPEIKYFADRLRKLQVAIYYAHEVRQASPDTWVFWVYASSRARFEEAYRNIADKLQLPGRDNPKCNILQLVYAWLYDKENGSWMMVLDNADSVDVLFLRQSTHGLQD
ncbi:Kinesin light chain [Ilyonectria robusta]